MLFMTTADVKALGDLAATYVQAYAQLATAFAAAQAAGKVPSAKDPTLLLEWQQWVMAETAPVATRDTVLEENIRLRTFAARLEAVTGTKTNVEKLTKDAEERNPDTGVLSALLSLAKWGLVIYGSYTLYKMFKSEYPRDRLPAYAGGDGTRTR